ncbi:MAG: toll/interleukin-1 receptor domain-containing protein, partial [Promethearchaeota archaeon]
VDNPTFIPPVDPWYSTIVGDATDVDVSSIPNQANYIVIGETHEKQIILNSVTYSDWVSFINPGYSPNLGFGFDSEGLYCGHDWQEPIFPSNYPIAHINWRLNVSIDHDMSNYEITSATLDTIINGTVNQDIDTPGDGTARWSPMVFINQTAFYDYAQFYIEISDLNLTAIHTYRIAFNQTSTLGSESTLSYNMEGAITKESEQNIIKAINNILSIDPGHNNFTISLGIYIYCEDNTVGFNNDRDQWEDLRFKFMNLTFAYEKKIDQFTSISWNQDLDKILGSYIQITYINLSFKYKVDQTWTSASQNSELRIYINDRKHDEVINLSNYVYSLGFQEAKLGGFNITSEILPYENFTLSIQLYIGDSFGLDSNITLSVTDLYMYMSYSEFIPDSPTTDKGSILPALIFFITSIILAIFLPRKPKGKVSEEWRGLEELSFTTGFPETVVPGKSYSLSVYLHLPKDISKTYKLIDDKAKENGFDSYIPTLESFLELECAIALKVLPNVEGITFEPNIQEIAWYKDVRELNFSLKADSQHEGKDLEGFIDIFKDTLFIGQIPLTINVSREEKPTKVAKADSRKFESVFVSYSKKDKDLVDYFIVAYEAIGIDVNLAPKKILSGYWEPQINDLISKSDVFQLYWSHNSYNNENVTNEWKEALKYADERGQHFIRPCFWEEDWPKAPKKLKKYHFREIDLKYVDLKEEIKEKLLKKSRNNKSNK